MKLVSTLIILMAAVSSPGSARAQQANYRHFDEAGFGDVGRLIQSMTPQQRNALLEQASIKEKDLQHLTPQQLEQLRKQLRDIANTIEIEKLDPKKLDVTRPKNAADVKKDVSAYQQKNPQAKPTGGAVKPKSAYGQ